MTIDADGKKVSRYRADREHALDDIEDAVTAGRQPGEVT
jgi:hypothetical protein